MGGRANILQGHFRGCGFFHDQDMIRQKSPRTGPIGAGRSAQRWRTPVVCLALAAITFAVFGQTLTHQFVNYDDETYVYDNPMVARGLTIKGIIWAFSCHAANWHPLTWLSHMLDCQLYGLHPGGHHLTNVLLHTATVIALFLVLRQMTGAFWRSAFVAAVFAIHPLRVESVAWVAERKDVLSGLFFMLTIGAYARYARQSWSFGRYGLVMLLFALGLMCKPMLVTLPLVLLLLDYWPLQRVETRKFSGLVLEKLPLLALSAASCVATLLAQYEGIQSAGSFSTPIRLANALVACVVYLGQMVWPAKLAVFYPYPNNGLPAWEAALAGTLLAGLSAIAWWQRRKQGWLITGWGWYLVMLLPVAGIIQVGLQAHADRYTYLPQIGIYVAATWWVAERGAKWRVSRAVVRGLAAGVLGALMLCAWKQTACWKNSENLWGHALACTSGNSMAHSGLGNVFLKREQLGNAITEFQQAVQLNPCYADAHNDLGTALCQYGRVDDGITEIQKALQLVPDNPAYHSNLGNALLQNGRREEAIAQYQAALQIKPDDAKARNNLANALLQQGKAEEAIAQYQITLQIDPGYAEGHYNLGNVFSQQGRLDDAITHFQKALQINPGDGKAENNLGIALVKKGKVAEAISHYRQALQLAPADAGALNNLAWLLATRPEASLRDGNKALELAWRANELTGGNNPTILHTLAAAFAEAGRFPEAVETAQRALNLAGAQSNTKLAGALQLELKLYQAGSPFHVPEQTLQPSAPPAPGE
jgi:Flp pilus assembly protein TadD